ncbi:MAG: proline racemase family protein [Planctomycetota bacterium]
MQIRRFVDSHTEGEPTRVLLADDGGVRAETLAEVIAAWSAGGELRVPPWLLALCANPRAADATVCALVCRPSRAGALCGVLFWNAAAPLGMCGHATIGLVRTLGHLGVRLPPRAVVETRVGDVAVEAHGDGRVSFANVPARVHAHDVEVVLEQGGVARGDIAWGGNWFFIVRHDGAKGRAMRSHAEELAYSAAIARGIARMGLRAGPENGGLIDHVLLLFAPDRADAHARNFVLCPNGTFDRSPCGTGTSALLAALAARGELAEGAPWRQESAIGSMFEARYAAAAGGGVIPTVTGRAFVTAEGRLVDEPNDPSREGAWSERR